LVLCICHSLVRVLTVEYEIYFTFRKGSVHLPKTQQKRLISSLRKYYSHYTGPTFTPQKASLAIVTIRRI
jgi:hypothetical protein